MVTSQNGLMVVRVHVSYRILGLHFSCTLRSFQSTLFIMDVGNNLYLFLLRLYICLFSSLFILLVVLTTNAMM